MAISKLVDLWLRRWAKSDPDAVRAAKALKPAVLITGGSRGIGLAIAVRFSRAGHVVILVGRDSNDLTAARDDIAKDSGRTPFTLALDVTSAEATTILDAFVGQHGLYVDIVINNAGFGLAGAFVDHSRERVDDMINLNVTALTRLTRHYLPKMIARSRGGVINIASLGGFVPGPYQAVYYASKAFVISCTCALAEENNGRGVRICAVAPGPVTTGFHADMGADSALYRWLVPALSPQAVANSTYRGYQLGHRLIIPGVMNWLLSFPAVMLPLRIVAPVIGWLLRFRS